MSDSIYYEFGEISGKTPLEAFYEAMLPLLGNYGLTAPFPADKPSLTQTVSDIEFSVLIGEPPEAIRYIKWQESPYRNGGIELTLEGETLVRKETGEKLYLKIFMTDYISGMSHAAGNLCLSVKFSGAQSEVEAFKNAVVPVLAEYGFRSRAAQKSPAQGKLNGNSTADSTGNLRSELMTNDNINFDELARNSFAPTAGESDFENLFAAVFSLDAWYFIADAEFSYKLPYCAPFPNLFGDAIALTVFTDGIRARKFIAEGGLKGGAAAVNAPPEDLIMSISTTNILDFFDQLEPLRIVKIFFNPNTDSHGFHHDLKMMRPIREHLEGKNLLTKTVDKTVSEVAPQTPVKTLIVQLKDGLGFPSGFVKAAEDTMHLFCRVPSGWVDGGGEEQLKPEYLEKIYARFYGANWRTGNSDGSHYEILDSYTKIFTPEIVRTTNFGGTVNQDKHQFFFYIGDNDDSIRKVTAEEFQADIDAEMRMEKPGRLTELLEENAELIKDFERENAAFSAMIAGSAAAMDEKSGEEKEQVVSNTAEMFESVRLQNNMSPRLFRIFIESCLKERKFLMPVVAFAYFQQDEAKMEKLRQDKALFDEFTNWLTRKISPEADLLLNKSEQSFAALSEKEAGKPLVDSTNGAIDSETSSAPFDELSRKATETGAMEDLNALFGAAFALSEWQFISRGELPGVYPYVASNAQYADNQPMIRAFTDTKRLQRFARENNLTEADGSCRILSIPTANIIEYLEGFIEQGAYGVWFNSDTESDGFFIPIKQLQPIRDHLDKIKQTPAEAEFTTLMLTITDGLMLPSGAVSKSSYNCNFFCWVPRAWTEDLQLKSEYLEKLYEQFYGANWRSGSNTDGSRYVVLEANSAVISPERVKDTKWNLSRNSELNRYWYYIADANGAFRNVSADEFQACFDSYFQTEDIDETGKQNENGKQQETAANLGISKTDDGDIDLSLNINKVGAVGFETSIAPFYQAIVPLLNDYEGSGEYVALLRFEPEGITELVENIAENAHGACLQVRRFLYLNPKNNVRIGVNSIHSRRLRRVQTNSELFLSFELCKNLDNQTAAFYYRFEGAKSEVLKLSAAIAPILESAGFAAAE